jgi:Domain of unknown function (DUF4332)
MARSQARGQAWTTAQIVFSLAALAVAWALLLRVMDPVPTWFYVFAWYPTLTLLDGVAVRLDGRPSLFARPGLALSLFAWSPVVWLAFEAANFRLQNWYYVFLPPHPVERWAGILLSFATVLPAVVLAERTLGAAGVFAGGRARPVIVRPRDLRASVWLALGAALLVLAWPRIFFPLAWGVGLFLFEPVAYHREPALSLVRDLERGDWGRVGRLLLGGLGIGLLWEFYNHWAEGSWIYTVPGLEQLKLFEMPPLGFLGFPIFALSAWAIYAALCAAGVAHPPAGERRLRARRAVPAALAAAVFTGLVLIGMEHRTISSTVPRLADLPGIAPDEVRALRDAGVVTARQLAATDPEHLASRVSLEAERVRAAVESARLATLRGLGAEHARALQRLGVLGRCDLVGRNPDSLAAAVRRVRLGARPTPAEVRVWTRGAEHECGIGAAVPGA